MTINPNTARLHALGQSLWLDNITRALLDSGTLQRYIDELSVTGLTSNPTIFDQALKGSADNPRAELQALISGPSFDRTQASALLQAKIAAVQLKSPELINAFGDFYDSLRPEQQGKLREALARGRHGHRDRHDRRD